jgi:hypothetical protein
LFFKWTSLVAHLLSYGGFALRDLSPLFFFLLQVLFFLFTEFFYRFLVSAGS